MSKQQVGVSCGIKPQSKQLGFDVRNNSSLYGLSKTPW